MCCFEQILEATPYKTADLQPLTSILTNHLSKINKICWARQVKQELTHKWRSLMESNTRTHQWRPTNKDVYTLALYGNWMHSRGPTRSDVDGDA